MHPILTRLGPFFVYSYTAVFALGLLLSWAFTAQKYSHKTLPGWQEGALAALLLGWLGARLGFIGLNWGYFATRPFEWWQLWQGGLTAYGGLLGGLFGLGLWCWWGKRPFLAYAAYLSPAFVLIIVTGWAACWAEGCAYGTTATLGPLTANLPDTFGIFAIRYQTQLLGIALNLLALLIVWLWQKRWGNGRLFALTLLLTNLVHLTLTFLRGDEAPLLASWRLDSWLALFFAFGGLILLQYEKSDNSSSDHVFR